MVCLRFNICSAWVLDVRIYQIVSDAFDTQYRAENFTNTDSDTDTNPYQSSNELFASRHVSGCIYEAF